MYTGRHTTRIKICSYYYLKAVEFFITLQLEINEYIKEIKKTSTKYYTQHNAIHSTSTKSFSNKNYTFMNFYFIIDVPKLKDYTERQSRKI